MRRCMFSIRANPFTNPSARPIADPLHQTEVNAPGTAQRETARRTSGERLKFIRGDREKAAHEKIPHVFTYPTANERRSALLVFADQVKQRDKQSEFILLNHTVIHRRFYLDTRTLNSAAPVRQEQFGKNLRMQKNRHSLESHQAT